MLSDELVIITFNGKQVRIEPVAFKALVNRCKMVVMNDSDDDSSILSFLNTTKVVRDAVLAEVGK